jgi:hypothetical protein
VQHSSVTRTVLGRLLLAGLLGLAAFSLRLLPVPNALNPFMPLNVRDEPNWLTGYKLDRLQRDVPQCLAALGGSPLSFSQVPDERTGEGCGFTNAVDVLRSSTSFSSGFKASCPLAVGWALFELHVLQQAARKHMRQEVVRVDHFGTYACRNLYHQVSGRRSEHATANAIDIAGVVLADGTTISVLSDWNGAPHQAAFLRALRDGACLQSKLLVGPYAALDELHFDSQRSFRHLEDQRTLLSEATVPSVEHDAEV